MTKKQFVIPKLNGLKKIQSTQKSNFVIPKLFDKNSQDEKNKPQFIIPTFGKPTTLPNLSSSPSNKEFKSLSEVVSDHLDSQILILKEQFKDTTLEDETKNLNFETNEDDLIKKIEKVDISKDEPLPCSFDSSHFMKLRPKLQKNRTHFAYLLCKRYKRSVLKSPIKTTMIPRKIKVFTFDTPSPDDFIKRHLKR